MHPAVNDIIEWPLHDRIISTNGSFVNAYAGKLPFFSSNSQTHVIYSLLTGVDDYTFGDRGERRHYWRITIGIQTFALSDREANHLVQEVDEILNPLDMRVQFQDQNGDDQVPEVKKFELYKQNHVAETFISRWDREWGDKLSIELLQRGRAIPEGFGTIRAQHDDFANNSAENSFSQGAEYRLILLGEG